MTRTIAAIDKDITANMRELRRRHPIKDRMNSAHWQAARDAHPDLDARDHELYRERGFAQQERDERAAKVAKVAARSESRRPLSKWQRSRRGRNRGSGAWVARAAAGGLSDDRGIQ